MLLVIDNGQKGGQIWMLLRPCICLLKQLWAASYNTLPLAVQDYYR